MLFVYTVVEFLVSFIILLYYVVLWGLVLRAGSLGDWLSSGLSSVYLPAQGMSANLVWGLVSE